MSIDNSLNILYNMYDTNTPTPNFDLDDFLLWCDQVWDPILKPKYGECIDPERAFQQWCVQGGRCAATGHFMKGAAEPAIVPVIPGKPLYEPGNCKIVVKYVATMYNSLGLPWIEFMAKIGSIKTW